MFLRNEVTNWNRVNYTTRFIYICEDFPLHYYKGFDKDFEFDSKGSIDYTNFIQQVKRKQCE